MVDPAVVLAERVQAAIAAALGPELADADPRRGAGVADVRRRRGGAAGRDTGPYVQYAVARLRSLLARAGPQVGQQTQAVGIREPAEQALALALLGLGSAVEQAGDLLEPRARLGPLSPDLGAA